MEKTTRIQRGIALAAERAAEFEQVTENVWEAPSATSERGYLVDLRSGKCECPDYQRRELPCKHLYAVEIVAAKDRRNR